MGNAATRVCGRYEAAPATGGRRRRCCKDAEAATAPAAARRAATTVARTRRPEEKVSARDEAEHSAATVLTVKVVMKKKDAERLVARLNEQNARGRKARMAEIKNELRAGDDCGAAAPSASPARFQDAWKHKLEPIQEN
ncbi:hypothetical protein GUJ93_ZPchr0001g30182 [Zizania palustris]|uniref:Uncharacterized protein n=1 Tax=Zizania palustris TaxID=103762 RepID=A0A8J5RY18_ZIZPA|nr:hypothetical protein GUJ93_ZPchr0001g30182 [Zizania palustris]